MPTVPADPVEAACVGRTEPTARWLREHPDWVLDRQKNAKLTAAHFDAEADGVVPDTPEYFARIEKQIGLRGNGSARGSAGGALRNSGVHPADFNPGDVSTHIRDGGREVFLTKGEAKAANDGTLVWNYGPLKGKPIGTQEAARRKAAMFAEGRYNRLD
jgi:hypothetical protein